MKLCAVALIHMFCCLWLNTNALVDNGYTFLDPDVMTSIMQRGRLSPEFVANSTKDAKTHALEMLDIWDPKGCITLKELHMAEFAFRKGLTNHRAWKFMLEAGTFLNPFLGYNGHMVELPDFGRKVDHQFRHADLNGDMCLNEDELELLGQKLFYGHYTLAGMHRLLQGGNAIYNRQELLEAEGARQVKKINDVCAKKDAGDGSCEYTCQCPSTETCMGMSEKKCRKSHTCGKECDGDDDCRPTQDEYESLNPCKSCVTGICTRDVSSTPKVCGVTGEYKPKNGAGSVIVQDFNTQIYLFDGIEAPFSEECRSPARLPISGGKTVEWKFTNEPSKCKLQWRIFPEEPVPAFEETKSCPIVPQGTSVDDCEKACLTNDNCVACQLSNDLYHIVTTSNLPFIQQCASGHPITTFVKTVGWKPLTTTINFNPTDIDFLDIEKIDLADIETATAIVPCWNKNDNCIYIVQDHGVCKSETYYSAKSTCGVAHAGLCSIAQLKSGNLCNGINLEECNGSVWVKDGIIPELHEWTKRDTTVCQHQECDITGAYSDEKSSTVSVTTGIMSIDFNGRKATLKEGACTSDSKLSKIMDDFVDWRYSPYDCTIDWRVISQPKNPDCDIAGMYAGNVITVDKGVADHTVTFSDVSPELTGSLIPQTCSGVIGLGSPEQEEWFYDSDTTSIYRVKMSKWVKYSGGTGGGECDVAGDYTDSVINVHKSGVVLSGTFSNGSPTFSGEISMPLKDTDTCNGEMTLEKSSTFEYSKTADGFEIVFSDGYKWKKISANGVSNKDKNCFTIPGKACQDSTTSDCASGVNIQLNAGIYNVIHKRGFINNVNGWKSEFYYFLNGNGETSVSTKTFVGKSEAESETNINMGKIPINDDNTILCAVVVHENCNDITVAQDFCLELADCDIAGTYVDKTMIVATRNNELSATFPDGSTLFSGSLNPVTCSGVISDGNSQMDEWIYDSKTTTLQLKKTSKWVKISENTVDSGVFAFQETEFCPILTLPSYQLEACKTACLGESSCVACQLAGLKYRTVTNSELLSMQPCDTGRTPTFVKTECNVVGEYTNDVINVDNSDGVLSGIHSTGGLMFSGSITPNECSGTITDPNGGNLDWTYDPITSTIESSDSSTPWEWKKITKNNIKGSTDSAHFTTYNCPVPSTTLPKLKRERQCMFDKNIVKYATIDESENCHVRDKAVSYPQAVLHGKLSTMADINSTKCCNSDNPEYRVWTADACGKDTPWEEPLVKVGECIEKTYNMVHGIACHDDTDCKTTGCIHHTHANERKDNPLCYVCDGEAAGKKKCFPAKGCNVCEHACLHDNDCRTDESCGRTECNKCRHGVCTSAAECDQCGKSCDTDANCKLEGCSAAICPHCTSGLCSYKKVCTEDQWTCNNGDCIANGTQCDTQKDCSDGSDEDIHCQEAVKCDWKDIGGDYEKLSDCMNANSPGKGCNVTCIQYKDVQVSIYCNTKGEWVYPQECKKPKTGKSFSANSLVRLDDGTNVHLTALTIGDKVLSFDAETGLVTFEEVYFIVHSHPWSGSTKRANLLKLFYNGVEESFIELTPAHLIYAVPNENDSLKDRTCEKFGNFQGCTYTASEINIGSLLFVASLNGTLLPTPVVKIEETSNQIRGVLTNSGNIIINNVVSSCYVDDHDNKHDTLAFIRFLYKWFPALFHSRFSTLIGILENMREGYGISPEAGVLVLCFIFPLWLVVATTEVYLFGV